MKKMIKKAYKPKKKPIRWLSRRMKKEESEDTYVKSVYNYDRQCWLVYGSFHLLVGWWLNWIVEWATNREISMNSWRVKKIKKGKENVQI